MNKKDFDIIAGRIREAYDRSPDGGTATRQLVYKLADDFAECNARFDRIRFLKACLGRFVGS
jgi:hypothetical protein